MGLAQGNVSSGPEGLQLVAWAVMDGSGLVRQSGFSAATRSSAGNFSFTFNTARASARYIVQVRLDMAGNFASPTFYTNSKTTAGMLVVTASSGAPADMGTIHVAVYE